MSKSLKLLYVAWSVLTLGFIVLPLLVIIWVSFFSNKILSFPPEGYTLSWYERAWEMESFRNGFLVSIETALIATIAALILGIPAAIAVTRAKFRGRELVQTVLLAPLVVPGIVSGAMLFMVFIEIEAATDIRLAGSAPGLWVAHTLIALPWVVRLVAASLVNADRSIEEAAASLGADRWTVFRSVTVPAIRPGLLAAALFAFVISFIDLEKSIFLVGPGKTTLQIALVNYLEWNLDSTVAAVATVQILVVATLLIVSDRFVRINQAF